jgi:hypothetical protein
MVKLIVFVGVLAAGTYMAMGKQWQEKFWSKGL